MLKIDFHVHTKYSHDSHSEVSDILQYAKRRGLDAIAIADHDNLEGSREARKIRTKSDVLVIPAMELTLPCGEFGLHILALNLDEYISYFDIKTAISTLKKKRALLVLPHPYREGTGLFYHTERGDISKDDVDFILENVDYIEVVNMKDRQDSVRKTLKLADKLGLPIVAGTDSHTAEFIGTCYTNIDNIKLFILSKSKSMGVEILVNGKVSKLKDIPKFLETGNGLQYLGKKSKGSSEFSINDLRRQRARLNNLFVNASWSSIKMTPKGLTL